ncbi:MAG: hypothetical protein ACRYG4_03565 [Janthinobacterium lividum]
MAKIAREKSRLHKCDIAARAGMKPRMLHRLSTGKTRASDSQRERILLACDLPVISTRLLVENNQTDLIGTGAQDWVELFFREAIANLASIKADCGMEVEGRWAASDAALIFARWRKILDKRRDFMTDYFAAECLGVQERD